MGCCTSTPQEQRPNTQHLDYYYHFNENQQQHNIVDNEENKNDNEIKNDNEEKNDNANCSRPEQLMQKFENDTTLINNEIDKILNVPLHHWTAKDISNKIKWWVYNDINYKKHLRKTMEILYERALNGNYDVKSIIKHELNDFMTLDTINMTCAWINECKYDENSAAQVGYDLYNYPLNELLNAIIDGDTDGKIFIAKYKNEEQFIKNITAWHHEEIYQIEATLFRHKSMTYDEFIENMNNVMTFMTKLPKTVKETMQDTISRFDEKKLDMLCFKIKRGEDIKEFSNEIINMINILIKNNQTNKNVNNNEAYFDPDFVKQIYELIAK
eukprot:7560_1